MGKCGHAALPTPLTELATGVVRLLSPLVVTYPMLRSVG